MTETEIVIVGLGPTGATLANILGCYGINVVVLEREESIYPLPRAVHFDDEAMRVFQSIQLADQIDAKVRVNCGTRFVDKNQDLLLDWPRPQEIGPLGWYPSYRFHQPDLEADLNDGLSRQETVQVMRGCAVTAVTQMMTGCRSISQRTAPKRRYAPILLLGLMAHVLSCAVPLTVRGKILVSGNAGLLSM